VYRTIALALALTGVFQPLVHAQGSADGECSALALQAFEAAGLNDLIAALPTQMLTGLESQLGPGSGVSATQKRQIAGAMKAAFLPSKTGALIRQEFLRTCDPDMLRSVIAGLATPLAVKIREMEVRSETPLGKRQLAEYTAGLAQHPPDPTRLALIQKLDASTGDYSFAMDIAVASLHGVGAVVGGVPQGFESSFREQIAKTVYNSLIVCLLSTYRDASNSDLVRYTELFETPPFARFSEQYQKAFLTVIERQSQAAMAAALKSVQPQQTLRD
jgi:hypothetical protein